jgi:hypothetical protein
MIVSARQIEICVACHPERGKSSVIPSERSESKDPYSRSQTARNRIQSAPGIAIVANRE